MRLFSRNDNLRMEINMKKFLIVLIILLLPGVSLSFAQPNRDTKRFFFAAGINTLATADSNFKDIYGSPHAYPGIRAGFFFYKNFYIWGGCGFLSGHGEIDIYGTKVEAKTNQRLISFGPGYSGSLTGKLNYRIETGGVYFRYEEEAMAEDVSASSYGFTVNFGISYMFNKLFYTEISAGYMTGVAELARKIKLGGVTAGIGFGIRF